MIQLTPSAKAKRRSPGASLRSLPWPVPPLPWLPSSRADSIRGFGDSGIRGVGDSGAKTKREPRENYLFENVTCQYGSGSNGTLEGETLVLEVHQCLDPNLQLM